MTTFVEGSYERLLKCLDANPDNAAKRYQSLHKKLAGIARGRGVLEDEECADETLQRVALKILMGEEVRNIEAFIAKVHHFIILEFLKKQAKNTSIIDDPDSGVDLPDESTPEAKLLAQDDEAQRLRNLTCMRECFGKLFPEEQLFMAGYNEIRKKSAVERTNAKRIRSRLKACVSHCESTKQLQGGVWQ